MKIRQKTADFLLMLARKIDPSRGFSSIICENGRFGSVSEIRITDFRLSDDKVESTAKVGKDLGQLAEAFKNTGASIKYIPRPLPKNHEYYDDIFNIRFLARANNWEEIDLQEQNRMISFSRDGVRMNIYYSTMTVGTAMMHPTKKNTQLFRKHVQLSELDKLFKNPRQHTGKGYYKK